MLLSSGCSFTKGQIGEGECLDCAWPCYLSKKLNVDSVDVSAPGSDNCLIIDEVLHYLTVHESYGLPKPKYVAVQTTDYFRKLLYKAKSSNAIKPNKFGTQHKLRRHFRKVNSNRYEVKTGRPSVKVQKKQYSEVKNIFSRSTFNILDSTMHHQTMEMLLRLNQLQAICKLNNIPLAIANYYGLGTWEKDPLALNLKDNLVVENPMYGLYNELLWLGFERPDNYHFEEAAHIWQADMFYDFFTSGKRITVNTKTPPNLKYTEVYDYTDELDT